MRGKSTKKTDGRKLDHGSLETIRVIAARQIVDEHKDLKKVADTLGMAESTVYGWVKKYREGGVEALAAKPIPGRPRKLSEEQAREIYTILRGNDPRQLNFEFALWTLWMVCDLIHRRFGVKLTEAAAGRMLRRMGMSPQRPLSRAYEQDADAVQHWKTEQYPAIRVEAQKAGATIYFQDESGVSVEYHSGTTWAPVGQTPVVVRSGAKHRVNMLSSITMEGKLHFMVHNDTVDSSVFIDYCKKLLTDDGGTVFLVIDNAPYHTSKETAKFVESTNGKLRLFFLPTYAPETNPDELVWKNVKHDRIGRAGVMSASDLFEKVTRALERLQAMPGIVRGFFRHPKLKYIHAVSLRKPSRVSA
jgi:transposase